MADRLSYSPVMLRRTAMASCAAAPCTGPVVGIVLCLAIAVHWPGPPQVALVRRIVTAWVHGITDHARKSAGEGGTADLH